MKCSYCPSEVLPTQKFCSECGNENINFKENKIDKTINLINQTTKRINDTVVNEVKSSEHINNTIRTTKENFFKLNGELVDLCFYGGLIVFINALILDTEFFIHPFEYTKSFASYSADETICFLIIFLTVIFFPLLFTIFKFNKSLHTKKYMLFYFLTFSIFIFVYIGIFYNQTRFN